jgi:hypothetical protein
MYQFKPSHTSSTRNRWGTIRGIGDPGGRLISYGNWI